MESIRSTSWFSSLLIAALLVMAAILSEGSFEDDASESKPNTSSEKVIHYIAGEFIALDHVNRTGTLRPDRTDAQRRGDWDLPLDFTLLPYGSVFYHGAPAELRHVPIGTHLHGEFYEKKQPPVDPKAKPDPSARKLSEDAKYSLALNLEDDFSHDTRLQRRWRVDAISFATEPTLGNITVTGLTKGESDLKPTSFQVGLSTRVWKDRGLGSISDLQIGQQIAINLTVCTLKGPGRCAEIWLDDESRRIATNHQLEVHRHFMREHGLPGIIDEIDNTEGIVTVNLFDGFDHSLIGDFASNEAIAAAKESAPFVPGPGLVDPIAVTAAVAEDNLRTWDQINDRKAGPMIEQLQATPSTGSSGIRVRFRPNILLEGFRPGRIIRLWPSKWKVDDLPREERLYQ